MTEEWKQIPGYEGLYEASSLGRIRSSPGKTTSNARFKSRTWKSRIMKPKVTKSTKRRDLRITLWKDGKAHDYLVARLVASAWLGSASDNMTVNHKDGNYLNNTPSNLEWITKRDNIRHGFATGLYSAIQRKIILVSDDTGESFSFPSMSEASRFLGRNTGYISCRVSKNDSLARSSAGKFFTIYFPW